MLKLFFFLGLLGCALSNQLFELKTADFEQLTNEDTAWFLGFMDKSCEKCEGELVKFAATATNVQAVTVNADSEPEMRKLFEVTKLPTFFFVKQKVIREYKGAITAEDFTDFVTDKYLEVAIFDNVDNLKTRLAKKEEVPVLNTIVISKDNVTALTSGSWMVLVFAPWCGHCKALHPIWAELSRSTVLNEEGIKVATIDSDANPDISFQFGVTGFPTIFFIKDGTIYRFNGARELKVLTEFAMSEYRNTNSTSFPYIGPSFVNTLDVRNVSKLYSDEWLVLMYAPWCGFCRKLYPIWDDFSASIEFKRSNVKLAKLDVSDDVSLQFLFAIESFPTIYRFSAGRVYLFNETERSAEALKTFALRTYKSAKQTNKLTGPTSLFRRLISAYIYYVILAVDYAKTKGISQNMFVGIVISASTLILIVLIVLVQRSQKQTQKQTEITEKIKENASQTKEKVTSKGESKKTK